MKNLLLILLLPMLLSCNSENSGPNWKQSPSLDPTLTYPELAKQWKRIKAESRKDIDSPDKKEGGYEDYFLFHVDYGGYGIVASGEFKGGLPQNPPPSFFLKLTHFRGDELNRSEFELIRLFPTENQIGPENQIRMVGPDLETGLAMDGEVRIMVNDTGFHYDYSRAKELNLIDSEEEGI